ncbi:MAG: TonB-dependent receptor [Pseudomonadales bacterium]|nr:TonB-dependent receptor [Pseudomonadales bacterium]
MSRLLLSSFGLFFHSFLPLSAALAQDRTPSTIEEITVSADFRAASVTDISASVLVLDSQLIQQKNAQHLEDILLNAPNVNFASGASRARFFQIRGIGERSQFAEPLNSSVGLIIDGVDFSGIGNAALLYDVEQVEILLGPQGTRYGSNALAGLINLKTRAPAAKAEYGLQLEAANHDSTGVAAHASGPLGSENLRYRIAAQNIQSDGFGRNLFLDRHTNKRNESSLRGKLAWDLADDISLDLTAAYVDVDNGYDAFSLDNIRDTLSDEPGHDRQESRLISSTLTFDRFEDFTLEAILAYADSDIEYSFDEDWVFTGFHPFEFSSTDKYFRDRLTTSGELRLVSTDAGALLGGRTDWVLGAYVQHQDVDLERENTFLPAIFNSSYRTDRLALFGESTTALNGHWSVEAGLRLERFDAGYQDSNQVSFAPEDTLFGGKLALNYVTGSGRHLYASVSRGYKPAGFNTDGSLDADLREFGAEKLWNYELGFKGALFDERVQTRVALFYMDRSDVQISSSVVRIRDDGSSEFIDFIGNAASGSNYGLEANVDWLASDRLKLYGSLGLLKTEFRNFIDANGLNQSGRAQAQAPSYQFTAGAGLALSPQLAFDINLQGRDAFFFSDSYDARSQAYELLNASLSYTLDDWHFTLWGRNLGNRDYLVKGFFFGNDPRDDFTPRLFTQLGEPRRVGLTLNLDF